MWISLLCLTAFAASASAECGWVLRAYYLDPAGVRWTVADAYERREACVKAANERGTSMPNVSLFRCLPDTVDPRGPKGK